MNKKKLLKSLLGLTGIVTIPTVLATTTACNSSNNNGNNANNHNGGVGNNNSGNSGNHGSTGNHSSGTGNSGSNTGNGNHGSTGNHSSGTGNSGSNTGNGNHGSTGNSGSGTGNGNQSTNPSFVFKTPFVTNNEPIYKPTNEIANKFKKNVFDQINENAKYFLQEIGNIIINFVNTIKINNTTKLEGENIIFDIFGSINVIKKFTINYNVSIKYGLVPDSKNSNLFPFTYSVTLDFGKNKKPIEKSKKYWCSLNEMNQIFNTLIGMKFINIRFVKYEPNKMYANYNANNNYKTKKTIVFKAFYNFFEYFIKNAKNWNKKSYFINTDISWIGQKLIYENEIKINDKPLNLNSMIKNYKAKIEIDLNPDANKEHALIITIINNDNNISNSKSFKLTQLEFDKLMKKIS